MKTRLVAMTQPHISKIRAKKENKTVSNNIVL